MMTESRQSLRKTRRWVVKIGSALITGDGKGLDREHLRHWVDQMADLAATGVELVVVSSGAVAEGMKTLYDDGIRKVMMGLTTLEEVYRVAKQVEGEEEEH